MSFKIALLGFGTVASGLPILMKETKQQLKQLFAEEIIISKVLVRNDEKKQSLLAAGHAYEFVTDMAAILEDDSIKIVIELMGRIEPAKTYIEQALRAKKHVISANKDLIAIHGDELAQLAQAMGVAFYYEGAVAGGIPILRTLSESLAADNITRILGVLNGTSNFMLTKMVQDGWSYQKALSVAQKKGYAESDPTNDVEGIDAAYKTIILGRFAFGMTLPFDAVSHQGLPAITTEDVALAQSFGYVIKLLGDIRKTSSGIAAQVSPCLVAKDHPLAMVNDVMNAVYVASSGLGESLYYGPGAGQRPTANAVLSDIVALIKKLTQNCPLTPFASLDTPLAIADASVICDAYYLRLLASSDELSFDEVLRMLEEQGVAVKKSQPYQKSLGVLIDSLSKTHLKELVATLEARGLTVVSQFKQIGDGIEN